MVTPEVKQQVGLCEPQSTAVTWTRRDPRGNNIINGRSSISSRETILTLCGVVRDGLLIQIFTVQVLVHSCQRHLGLVENMVASSYCLESCSLVLNTMEYSYIEMFNDSISK